jgi:hemerythrin
MKKENCDVTNYFGIHNLDEDHQAIFNYIEQLQNLVNEPKNHTYTIGILEILIAFFLAHVINEEQQYLPTNTVEEHILLHKSELDLLDASIRSLKLI